MARNSIDDNHNELVSILEELLASDTDITFREVARRHTLFSNASTITRHAERRKIFDDYQQKQTDLRQWKGKLGKTSKEDTARKLASQQARISELEMTVKALTQGHLALIASVAQVGGMGKLSKYYESFREVRNQLADCGAFQEEINK